jgi:type I restriction enzyme S subunit
MASVKDMHPWGINIETCRKISEHDFRQLQDSDCIMVKNDVLIAKDGSYLKHCFVVEEDMDIALLSSIAILRPNKKINPHILALTMKQPEIKARMAGYVSGAALPRIILKDFKKFKIKLPKKEIQVSWENCVGPIIKSCYRIIDINTNLRQTRDLLLPKLISGKVDVSELDIDVVAEA